MLPAAGDFGGAFGAARLAMMAATGAGAEIATLPPIARQIDPNPSLTRAFDAGPRPLPRRANRNQRPDMTDFFKDIPAITYEGPD